MKNLKILAFCALTAISSIAYGQKTQALGIRVLEDWEESYYYYNDNNQLDSIHIFLLGDDTLEMYRLFEYDEKGNNTVESGFQWDNNTIGFRPSFKTLYTYTDDGQMKSRDVYNYNKDSLRLMYSSRMEWEYKDGRLDKIHSYFPNFDVPGELDKFLEERCFYDRDVLTRKEYWVKSFFSSDYTMSSSIDYTYNKFGFVELEVNKSYDTTTGAIVSTMKDVFKYDNDGNMFEYNKYMDNGAEPQLKYIYHFNKNVKSKNVALPYNYEDMLSPHITAMMNSTNIIEMEEWWQVPMEQQEIKHAGDYIYTYKEHTSSIEPGIVKQQAVNFLVDGDRLLFIGLPAGQTVELFDMNGALLHQSIYTSKGVSLSALPKGIYVARAGRYAFRIAR